MHVVAKKTVAIASAFGVAGISSLFFGAAPASATTPVCGTGTLHTDSICEQTFTSDGTFTATKSMTHLQVLLVGGGGDGAYSGGGGGGAVKIVDFDGGTARKLTIEVGNAGGESSVENGTATGTAAGGTNGINGDSTGQTKVAGTSGVSGNGNAGWPEAGVAGGGGGAAGSPTSQNDGGAGLVASSASIATDRGTVKVPEIPLFADDLACYGGGGAVGDGTTDGVPGCNAGWVQSGGTITAPSANFGGGGASITPPDGNTSNSGAGGVVVVRWNAKPAIELKFDDGGHGDTPAAEHLLPGQIATTPTSPVVKGYTFVGWYTSSKHKTPATFSNPLTKSETFYGKFTKTPKP